MGNTSSIEKIIDEIIVKELKNVSEVKSPNPMTVAEFIKVSDDWARQLKLPFMLLNSTDSDGEDEEDLDADYRKNNDCVFPSNSARIKFSSYTEDQLAAIINSARPVIHEKLVRTLIVFLHFKKRNGTDKERRLYAHMTFLDLVDRIIRKRPLMFCDAVDNYKLMSGRRSAGGFDMIGQKKENKYLSIKDYMTYDEMKFGALLTVTSWSYFINNGARHNQGIKGRKGNFESDGIILGQVGTRFQKLEVMEFIDCVICESQNTEEKGYGLTKDEKHLMKREWARLWEVPFLPKWEDRKNNELMTLLQISDKYFLNINTYKNRIKMEIDIYLLETQNAYNFHKKKLYIHVVGLGLGVWRITPHQEQIYVDCWGEVLKSRNWNGINYINFSWISVNNCIGIPHEGTFPNTDIKILFSKRNMHDPIPEGHLLMCHYAWDGNSLPGNEYWSGSLTSSADPAAACSSCVAEVQNHYINRNVSPENLHIATSEGILHIADYAKKYLSKLPDISLK